MQIEGILFVVFLHFTNEIDFTEWWSHSVNCGVKYNCAVVFTILKLWEGGDSLGLCQIRFLFCIYSNLWMFLKNLHTFFRSISTDTFLTDSFLSPLKIANLINEACWPTLLVPRLLYTNFYLDSSLIKAAPSRFFKRIKKTPAKYQRIQMGP